MLTDDDVRLLLHRAGETVDVDPAQPVMTAPPRRRAWPVLAAAAAVVLVAAVTVTVASRPDSGPEPAEPAAVTVPSVLGYDFDTALQVLHDAGFSLTSETFHVCNVSYAAGTEPGAGTPLEPGAQVVIRWAVASQAFCTTQMDIALDLLAFADGRGPAPRLAPIVTLYDGTGTQVILTAGQAADPDRWRVCTSANTCTSILDELSDAAHRTYPIETNGTTRYQTPELTAWPNSACEFEPGVRGFGAPDARIGVQLPVDGVFCTQEFAISVHRNADGLIEAVGLLVRRTG